MTVRLTNEATGAVVSVSDDTAARLGPEWVRVKPAKAAPTRSAKKSEDEK